MFKKLITPVILTVILASSACTNIPQTGFLKDVTSHLTTTYTGIKPEEVFIFMNNEKINSNKIPLGNEFQIVNNKISGLQVVDGKVSFSGEMKIADKKGNILLNEPDLFKGKGTYPKDEANYLTATVNTGQPMEVGQLYIVTITYKDKYGKGSLVNEAEIEIVGGSGQ